jgi:hypothetical protein
MHAPFVFSSIQSYPQLQSFFYLEFMWWSVPHFNHCYSLPLSKHTGRRGATPTFSGQLVYLQLEWGVLLPYSLELRVPCPLCYLSFFSSCLFIIQFGFFFFFPWVGGQSVQGAMLICSRVVCGSTTCCLAHLVVCFSQA